MTTLTKKILLISLLYLSCSHLLSIEVYSKECAADTENSLYYAHTETVSYKTTHFLTSTGTSCYTSETPAKEEAHIYMQAIECWEENTEDLGLEENESFFNFLLPKIRARLIPETEEKFKQFLLNYLNPSELNARIRTNLDLRVYWLFFNRFRKEISPYFPDSWAEAEDIMLSYHLESPHALKEKILLSHKYPKAFSSGTLLLVTCKANIEVSQPSFIFNPSSRSNKKTRCLFQFDVE